HRSPRKRPEAGPLVRDLQPRPPPLGRESVAEGGAVVADADDDLPSPRRPAAFAERDRRLRRAMLDPAPLAGPLAEVIPDRPRLAPLDDRVAAQGRAVGQVDPEAWDERDRPPLERDATGRGRTGIARRVEEELRADRAARGVDHDPIGRGRFIARGDPN